MDNSFSFQARGAKQKYIISAKKRLKLLVAFIFRRSPFMTVDLCKKLEAKEVPTKFIFF